jgi:hypothetical protein
MNKCDDRQSGKRNKPTLREASDKLRVKDR